MVRFVEYDDLAGRCLAQDDSERVLGAVLAQVGRRLPAGRLAGVEGRDGAIHVAQHGLHRRYQLPRP
ncbi:hypothetical protein ACG02S_25840 [Roseateles sp. DC23W]|uniref:Uncharacterized protein n=1 Tax=Pelomonas dachongensis TaxID=3299029 RepID=A0ABW7EVC8_9BURK